MMDKGKQYSLWMKTTELWIIDIAAYLFKLLTITMPEDKWLAAEKEFKKEMISRREAIWKGLLGEETQDN